MKNKALNIILLIMGICFVITSITFLRGDEYKNINGLCLGSGAGLIALAFANLIMIYWYEKHPKALKQAEIDLKDERNELIRNKAKADSADIIQWVIMGIAWITILADFPLWISLLLIGVFLLKIFLEIGLMNKYNKSM